MRIGIQCNEYPPALHGGIGSVVKDLAEGFVQRGVEVTVFGVYLPIRIVLERTKETVENGVRVLRAPYRRLAPVPAADVLIQRVLMHRWARTLAAKHSLQVIESDESTGWFPWGLSGSTPLVTRLHGGVVYFGKELERRHSRIQGWCERRQLLASTSVIGVSDYVGRQTMKHHRLSKTYDVIYNAPGNHFLRAREPATTDNLGEHSKGERYVLFTGSVLPKKGLESLVKAMNRIFVRFEGIELLIAGKNIGVRCGEPFEQYLRQFLHNEHQARVRFLDHVDRENELVALISNAEFVVLPSFSEAFSLAPLEAMALGKAVIYSRLHSGPEVIEHGVDGWLVDPADVRELAEAIERLLTDSELRRRLGWRARETVKSRFHYNSWLETNERFYRAFLEERSGVGRGIR